MKRFKRGFTLAEVLITLAIIGVVAAISIPSVISNTQQQEFKTGLRKAVSVLNSAITMNMAIDGESPYDNKDLFSYLQRHMSIMKSSTRLDYVSETCRYGNKECGAYSGGSNAVFYTTDGMRFEFHDANTATGTYLAPVLHESGLLACVHHDNLLRLDSATNSCHGCGSYGLGSNPNETTKRPCAILVDVNGDRKPTPGNVNCKTNSCMSQNQYKMPMINGKKIGDIFTILITDEKAIPYGVVAQKAMYDAQK